MMVTDVRPHQEPHEGADLCPMCLTEVLHVTNFCPRCGTPVDSAGAQPPPPAPADPHRHLLRDMIILWALAASFLMRLPAKWQAPTLPYDPWLSLMIATAVVLMAFGKTRRWLQVR